MSPLTGHIGYMVAVLYPFQQYFSHIRMNWEGDTERLCGMEPCSHLERFLSPAGVEPRQLT